MMGTFYKVAILKFDDTYGLGINIYNRLVKEMRGVPGSFGSHDYGLMAQCVKFVGDGDYLEIGCAYGFSAILVALVKRELGIKGTVTCIDKMPGTQEGFANVSENITPEVLFDNAKRMGVEIELVQALSEPFPVMDRRFAMTFIDGWHKDGQPTRDWNNVKAITDKLVLFHDYDEWSPDVLKACLYSTTDPAWLPIHISGNTFVTMKRE